MRNRYNSPPNKVFIPLVLANLIGFIIYSCSGNIVFLEIPCIVLFVITTLYFFNILG